MAGLLPCGGGTHTQACVAPGWPSLRGGLPCGRLPPLSSRVLPSPHASKPPPEAVLSHPRADGTAGPILIGHIGRAAETASGLLPACSVSGGRAPPQHCLFQALLLDSPCSPRAWPRCFSDSSLQTPPCPSLVSPCNAPERPVQKHITDGEVEAPRGGVRLVALGLGSAGIPAVGFERRSLGQHRVLGDPHPQGSLETTFQATSRDRASATAAALLLG